MESWKPIKGFEDRYTVSDTGLVFSKLSGRLLTPKVDRYGYEVVALSRNRKMWHATVHRLVAMTFIPNPHSLPCVNHKDENKRNNRVDNLEWVTVKENDNYGTRNQRMAESKKKRPIAQYDMSMNLIRIHPGVKDAHRNTGVNRNSIRDVCQKRRSSAGGYIWGYWEEVSNA